jgi:uncharacterized protein YegP (UPF0339 family)
MSETFPEVFYVDIKRSKKRFPLKRPQQWYFVLLAAGNHEPVMTSEMFTNHGDCVAAAEKYNGDTITVFLRQKEIGNLLVRRAVPSE